MATDSQDDHGHCASAAAITAENEDGDHFLCEAKSGADLEPIFKQAVEQLTGGSKLVPVLVRTESGAQLGPPSGGFLCYQMPGRTRQRTDCL